jgi:hypothetical protein
MVATTDCPGALMSVDRVRVGWASAVLANATRTSGNTVKIDLGCSTVFSEARAAGSVETFPPLVFRLMAGPPAASVVRSARAAEPYS